MAKKPIDYLYSAYSAYAYIGHGAFLQIAREANRPVIHRPFDLMKCLNAIGYHPLEERTEASLTYQFSRQRDRWSEFRNVPMPKATPSTHDNGAEIANLVLLAAFNISRYLSPALYKATALSFVPVDLLNCGSL